LSFCYHRYLRSFPTRRSSDLKNCFAFSRPWPRRSPLYEYHAPLFSMISISEAMSNISPSFEIPSPYIISTSACLKGGATLFFTRSEEHTSELQSRENLVCRLL